MEPCPAPRAVADAVGRSHWVAQRGSSIAATSPPEEGLDAYVAGDTATHATMAPSQGPRAPEAAEAHVPPSAGSATAPVAHTATAGEAAPGGPAEDFSQMPDSATPTKCPSGLGAGASPLPSSSSPCTDTGKPLPATLPTDESGCGADTEEGLPATGNGVGRMGRDDPKYLRSALNLSLQVEHSEMGAAIARMEEAYSEQHRAEAALSRERARAAEAEAQFRGQLEEEQAHTADLRRRCASAVAAACAASLGVRQARDELAAVEAAAAVREGAARAACCAPACESRTPPPESAGGAGRPLAESAGVRAQAEESKVEAGQATGAAPKLYSPNLFRRILRDGNAALSGAEGCSPASSPRWRQSLLFRDLQ